MRKQCGISPEFKEKLWERVVVLYEYRVRKREERSWKAGFLLSGAVALGLVLSVLFGERVKEGVVMYGTGRELRGVEGEMRVISEMQSLQEDDFESYLLALENL